MPVGRYPRLPFHERNRQPYGAERRLDGQHARRGARKPLANGGFERGSQARRRAERAARQHDRALRQIELFKAPGVAETIDWASALTELDKVALDPETVSDTIGVLLKYQDDIARIEQGEGRRILKEVKVELSAAAE